MFILWWNSFVLYLFSKFNYLLSILSCNRLINIFIVNYFNKISQNRHKTQHTTHHNLEFVHYNIFIYWIYRKYVYFIHYFKVIYLCSFYCFHILFQFFLLHHFSNNMLYYLCDCVVYFIYLFCCYFRNYLMDILSLCWLHSAQTFNLICWFSLTASKCEVKRERDELHEAFEETKINIIKGIYGDNHETISNGQWIFAS